ncbi:MAG TPA: TMEM175 family protein [Candidatus Acidoferrales bacterium]|nr:TMEM175 family protein [Candidatus Acidoferrales bacterium]
MKPQERAERLTRRIESFSDVVIGFGLALLALTLSIPPHIVELVTNPWWLIAYFWTFLVISGLWYNHQRLFTHFFCPEPLTIGLNFAFLSTIGLLVFFVQVFVHYHDSFQRFWAFLAYFSAFGLGFTIMGVLYLHGTWRRWLQLDGEDRYTGLLQAARGIIGGVALLIGVALSASRAAKTFDDLLPLGLSVTIGFIGVRVAMAILKPRIANPQTVR